ncbi:hypothetical protein E4T56_gene20187 [Termitomyces sp. T112]|nr:hypothetical protein E4T56_gene20187 [Termitomyces sp. T112]KAH0590159.1 hypothetical protein H2248_000333 [Termitomyces sp. 'cryptogamus']KNZ78218.1 hypothetical protein J132_01586 [Termitomyces sp. J132]
MVHLYLFNPVPKLRLLSGLFFKGSKHILESVSEPRNKGSAQLNLRCTPYYEAPIEASIPKDEPPHHSDCYINSRNGFCVFQVENTLFNVHQIMLSREPSAFDDMLCLPRPADDIEGNEENPVLLTDTAQQFRDFLWALYAPPNELFLETSIDRLLNVAMVANKYCLSSLEAWTINRIYSLAKDPTSSLPLHSIPLGICARMLDIAILCDHRNLQNLVTQVLISRTLWYSASPEVVLGIAEKHALRTLIGVCYYRQLISLEHSLGRGNSRVTQTVFPASMDVDKRMHFLAAHHSLLNLWEGIRAIPPALSCEGCPSHVDCEVAWQHMWRSACEMDEMLRPSSADVLGRMKALMLGLRKAMADAPSMSIQCKMSALEAITEIRDEVIDGLIQHFMKPM